MTYPSDPRVADVRARLAAAYDASSAPSEEAAEKLAPLIYTHLHRLARHYMNRERGDHTLQTTALVNEAYLKLVEQKRTDWRDRARRCHPGQVRDTRRVAGPGGQDPVDTPGSS